MTVSRFISVLAAALAMLIATIAPAQDVVVLTDGTEIQGEIVRELEGNIWIDVGVGSVEVQQFYAAGSIREIRRDAVTNEAPEADATRAPAPVNPGTPKGAVITLEGTVGIQMTAKTLRDILPDLERELGTDGTGIVVFKINSGGGLLLEIQRLSDVIQEEYKPRFRVVAWIESAISAAAMTSHAIEEIYFMPRGNYGACTGWSGSLTAMSGRGLEGALYMMEQISARGGYDPRIMRAMQIDVPLRATIDQRTGEVTWFESEDAGEILVNPQGEVLTFNSQNALQLGFSRGTASTLDELTTLLREPEIQWVGRWTPELIHPIGRAEERMIRFRNEVTEDEKRLNEYLTNYNISVGAAQGANQQIRGALVGRARRHLDSVVRMVKRNPNFALLNFNMTEEDFKFYVEEQEEMLREILNRP